MNKFIPKGSQTTKVLKFIKSLVPRKIIFSISEWAELTRVITGKVTKKSGKFSYDNAPFTREIVDNFSPNDPTRKVAVRKAAQVAFTTGVIESIVGFFIDIFPVPMLLVSASEKLVKEFKKVRIDNLIDNSGLREKIVPETSNKNSRRQGDTASMLEFIGGFLKFVGANSGSELRNFSVRVVLLDEVDGYPDEIKGEGSPVELAVARAVSFTEKKKILFGSTPVGKHNSKIEPLFLQGDQRVYLVPCPFCNEHQELVFYERDGGLYNETLGVLKDEILTKPYGLLYTKKENGNVNYNSVVYRCKYCGSDIEEHYKPWMTKNGYWKPTAEAKEPFFKSYYITGLLSHTKEWWDIVKEFVNAGNDPKKLQTFYNLTLGLPFEDTTAGIDITVAHKLRNDDSENNAVPREALFLTAVTDVQDDRLETEIKAWGDRWRNWGIDHRIIYGDTSDINDPCWQELFKIYNEDFQGRTIPLKLIDSGDGEKTDLIYTICEEYNSGEHEGLLLPIKGFNATIKSKEKFKFHELKDRGLVLVEAYVDLYKNLLSRWFAQEWRKGENCPDGWVSLAKGYSNEYLRQLTTEKKVKERTKSGLITIKWVQHGRNEAFDLNVYNLCCAEILVSEHSKKMGYEQTNAKAVFEDLKG